MVLHTAVRKKATWIGLSAGKRSVTCRIIERFCFELKPSLVIEFGTCHGGSALFFASAMRQISEPFKALSWTSTTDLLTQQRGAIPTFCSSNRDPRLQLFAEHIQRLKSEFPGKIFAILDSGHTMNHVPAEMKLLRPLLSAGDYLIVKDPNINGHPPFLDADRARMKPSKPTSRNSQTTTRMTWRGRTNSARHTSPTDSRSTTNV